MHFRCSEYRQECISTEAPPDPHWRAYSTPRLIAGSRGPIDVEGRGNGRNKGNGEGRKRKGK